MEHSRNATRTVKSLVVVTAFTKVIDPCLTALGLAMDGSPSHMQSIAV
jgi:hypothetical protein